MDRNWIMVFAASLFEVAWVIGLKHADTGLEWAGTAVAICISFYGMMAASKHLPVGNVYAVFVGLGTAGTALMDMAVFGDEWNPIKIGLLLILLGGVIGLKIVSNDKREQKEGN